jgi:hypothetical protein
VIPLYRRSGVLSINGEKHDSLRSSGPTIAPSARSPRWGENGFAALIKVNLSFCLVSSKLHPFCGKKQQKIRMGMEKRNGIQDPISPKKSVISTCLTDKNRPKLRVSRGLSLLAGFGAAPQEKESQDKAPQKKNSEI